MQVSVWRLMRLSMVRDAELHYAGIRKVKQCCWGWSCWSRGPCFLEGNSNYWCGKSYSFEETFRKFIGPYQVLKRIRPVAYEIALPPQLTNLHFVFHVSQLKKYVPDASHVLEMEDLPIREDLTVDVQPVAIEDHQMKQLKGRTISLVKVV